MRVATTRLCMPQTVIDPLILAGKSCFAAFFRYDLVMAKARFGDAVRQQSPNSSALKCHDLGGDCTPYSTVS